jgi:hypothetical protein
MPSRLLLLPLGLAAPLGGCEDKVPEPAALPKPTAEAETGPKELVKEDLKVGDGAVIEKGMTVKVHYTGRLLSTNYKFDSSQGKDPLKFTIGEGKVIKGWEQGVVGMKVGGKRKLTIPSDLAYGKEGHGTNIPPNAALVFEVELVSIVDEKDKDKEEEPAEPPEMDIDMGDLGDEPLPPIEE